MTTVQEGIVTRFYRGEARDGRGRTIDEIQRWDYRQLEEIHDYIQWLFPLEVPSRFNPDAPLVIVADKAAFRTDASLRVRLAESLRVMLDFYGFAIGEEDGKVRITRAAHFSERAAEWVTVHNHNFLRITRIITSLCLLGLWHEGFAFLKALECVYNEYSGRIGAETLRYWRTALR